MDTSSLNDPVRSSDRGVSEMEDKRSRSDYGEKQLLKNVNIAHLDQLYRSESMDDDPRQSSDRVSSTEDIKPRDVYGDDQSLRNVRFLHPYWSPSSVSQTESDDVNDRLYCVRQGCTASFTGTCSDSKGNMVRHMRRHESESEYQCQDLECNKVFKRHDARLKHYRKKHPRLAAAYPLVRRSSASREALQTKIK